MHAERVIQNSAPLNFSSS